MRHKKQKSGHFKLIAIALCGLTSLKGLAEDNSMSLGKLEYGQGNYQKALSYFDTAIKEQPNDIAFYYRADTLVNLGLKTQALSDYEQAYKSTTSTTMQNYCLKAMSCLTHNTIPALNSTTSSKSTAYSMRQNELDQSLGTIEVQSALDKVRIIGSGELLAQDATIKQQIQLDKMKREAEQHVQSMQNAVYSDQMGAKQSVYSTQQIQSYLDQRRQMEQPLQESINKSMEQQEAPSKQRAQYAEESAANLASQLQGGPSPDGVKLDPLGTNLYVRNYDFTNSSDTLPKPPVPLKAKEKAIQ